jgi:ribosomal protein S6--L-glutamate ligase
LDKIIVGSREYCSLPDLGIVLIKAKVDSGAKTTALHADNVEVFQKNNQDWVRFSLQPFKSNAKIVNQCEARLIDNRIIKSSNGQRENRYVIKTTIILSNQSWEIEVTLTNRDFMGFRMLLGREAMAGKILIDPEKRYILGKPKH